MTEFLTLVYSDLDRSSSYELFFIHSCGVSGSINAVFFFF